MVAKTDLDYRDAFIPTMEALLRDGALLVSTDAAGRPGGMTFGWGSIGTFWGRPIFTVTIRPSRNSTRLLEASGDFTVNLLPKEMGSVLDFWGKHSGRDVDKWARTGLRPAPARKVASPIVEQGILHFECRILHRQLIEPKSVAPELVPAYYAADDYHCLYQGEIVACYGV